MKIHYQMWPAEGSVIKYELDLQSPKLIQSVFVGLQKTKSPLDWLGNDKYKENIRQLQRDYLEKNKTEEGSVCEDDASKIKSESVMSGDEATETTSDVDEAVGDDKADIVIPLRVSSRKRKPTPKAEALSWVKKARVRKTSIAEEEVATENASPVTEPKEQGCPVPGSDTVVLAVELDEDWMQNDNDSTVIEIKPSEAVTTPSKTGNRPRRNHSRRSIKDLQSIINTPRTRSEPLFADCVFYCVICLKVNGLGVDSPGAQNYEYGTRLSLKNHIVKEHNSTPGQQGSSVNCIGCNKRFYSKDVDALYVYRFLKHMEEIHECRYYRKKKQEVGDNEEMGSGEMEEQMQQAPSSAEDDCQQPHQNDADAGDHSPLKMVVDEFKCPHCVLERNIDIESDKANEFLYPTRLALRNHIIDNHGIVTYSPKKTKSMACICCNKKFVSRDNGHGYVYRYLNHIQYTHNVTYFKYGNPKRVKHAGQYNAQSAIEWGRHFLGMNANLIYLCVFCHKDNVLEGTTKRIDNSMFMSRDEFSQHITDTHMMVSSDSESLQCPLCPYDCSFKVAGFASQLICRIMYHIEDHHRILYFFPAEDIAKGVEAVISVKSEDPSVPPEESEADHPYQQKDGDDNEDGIATVTVKNLQLLKCALCKQEFEEDALLKEHWASEHSSSGSITCEICAETCFSAREYHVHAWLRHKVRQ